MTVSEIICRFLGHRKEYALSFLRKPFWQCNRCGDQGHVNENDGEFMKSNLGVYLSEHRLILRLLDMSCKFNLLTFDEVVGLIDSRECYSHSRVYKYLKFMKCYGEKHDS